VKQAGTRELGMRLFVPTVTVPEGRLKIAGVSTPGNHARESPSRQGRLKRRTAAD
jgi:hypothetical protein